MAENEKVRQIQAYWNGFRKALWDYAWYRDGEMYVGCGVRRYREVLNEADEHEKRQIEFELKGSEVKDEREGEVPVDVD